MDDAVEKMGIWMEDGLLYLGILGIKPLRPEFIQSDGSFQQAKAEEELMASCVFLHMPDPARVVLLEIAVKGGSRKCRRKPRS